MYEEEIQARLNAIRTSAAEDPEPQRRATPRALAGLAGEAIAERFGVHAIAAYATRVAREEHAAGTALVAQWRRRPGGEEAIEELVAALENDHPDEIANATGTSDGTAAADLIAIVRDETTRELYERLVTRLASRRPVLATVLRTALATTTIDELADTVGRDATERFRYRAQRDDAATPDSIVAWWLARDDADDVIEELLLEMTRWRKDTDCATVPDTRLAPGALLASVLCDTNTHGWLDSYETVIDGLVNHLRHRRPTHG